MLRYILCFALLLLAAACSSVTETPGEQQAPAETGAGKDVAAGDGILVGKPATHENLSVFPLYLAESGEAEEDYITLREALASKQVAVREVGAQPAGQPAEGAPSRQQAAQQSNAGTVNAVEIENASKQSLYILAGQVIVGGKQDRVITKDTIVPPGEKIRVEVCCVEHGRWSPRHLSEGGPEAQSISMAFCNAPSALAGKSIKKLAQARGEKGQSEVWREVEKSAEKMDAQTSTGTYKEVVEKTEEKVDKYLAALNAAFGKDEKICGFVTCINGEVETCDLFASAKLLTKFSESLLRGYALDALNAGKAKDAKEATVDSVKSFINDMLAAQKNATTLVQDKHRKVKKLETERVIGFSNDALDAKDARRVLHLNAYSKKK